MSIETLSRLFRVGKFYKAGNYLISEIEDVGDNKIITNEDNIIAIDEYHGKLIIIYKNNQLKKFLFYMGIGDDELLEFVIKSQNKE